MNSIAVMQRQPAFGISRRSGTTLRVDVQTWERFALENLEPCPGYFVPLQRLAHEVGRFTGKPWLVGVICLGATLRAAGWADRLADGFFGRRKLVCLTGYRLASDPSPAEFLSKVLTRQRGARVRFGRVVEAFNVSSAAGVPLDFKRVQAILSQAAPDVRIARGFGRTFFLHDFRFVDDRTPHQYVDQRLVADPGALTPVAHIAADFNCWWQGLPAWSASRVGALLANAGLPSSSADFRGRHNVACLRDWRVVSDRPIAAFLAQLERAPGEMVTLQEVTAAFNEGAPSGGIWTDRRMADFLRGRGYSLSLKRRAGVNRVFIEHHRLLGHQPKPATPLLVAEELAALACPDLTVEQALRLAAAGIKTREDLADLATDELQQLAGVGLSTEAAEKIIMAARAHWFAPAVAAQV
ncbi:MAG: helix-hairpin-helix domain-containing protein [Rhodospirillaceae bacterium]